MNSEANHPAPTPAPTAHLETKPSAQFVVLTGRGGAGLCASIARLTAGRVGTGGTDPASFDPALPEDGSFDPEPGGLSARDNDESDNQSWGLSA